jgi:hypothetical protein
MNLTKAVISAVLLLAVSACGSGKFNDGEDDEFVGATAQAASISTDQGLVTLSGTYTNCVSHTNGEKWSVPVGSYAGALPFPKLRVAKTNTACQLSLTDARDAATTFDASAIGGCGNPTNCDMTTTSQGPLGTSYVAAKPYTTAAERRKYAFWGTAKIDSTSFTSGFLITFLYSDNAAEVTANISSQVSAVSGTATLERVPAPNYTIDVSTFNVYTALATPNVVESTEGNATFTLGTQAGENYRLVMGGVGTTWGDLASAYDSGTVPPGGPITGSPFSVASTALLANGATLPATRTIIVRHDDTATGIPSYQFFTLTFN